MATGRMSAPRAGLLALMILMGAAACTLDNATPTPALDLEGGLFSDIAAPTATVDLLLEPPTLIPDGAEALVVTPALVDNAPAVATNPAGPGASPRLIVATATPGGITSQSGFGAQAAPGASVAVDQPDRFDSENIVNVDAGRTLVVVYSIVVDSGSLTAWVVDPTGAVLWSQTFTTSSQGEALVRASTSGDHRVRARLNTLRGRYDFSFRQQP